MACTTKRTSLQDAMQKHYASGEWISPKALDDPKHLLELMKEMMAYKERTPPPKIETTTDHAAPRKIHRLFSHGKAIVDFRDDGTYRLLVDVMEMMEMGGLPRALAQIVLDRTREGHDLGVEASIRKLEEAGFHAAAQALREHAYPGGDPRQASGDQPGHPEPDGDDAAPGAA